MFFHAYWCKSCPKMAQVFGEVAKEMKSENMKFTDIDCETDWGVDMSSKYQVRNVPTVLVVEKGRVIKRIAGTRTANELKEELK